MLLLAGFRYQVGTDYGNYERAFVEEIFWFPEQGFRLVIKLLKNLNFSAQGYFFVLAFLIQILIIKSIKKYSDNKEGFYLSLFFYISLYYFNHSMNTIRQFIAIAIFLLNINNVIERRFFRYNIYFIIMFLFHQSSIIFYPIYFIYNILSKLTNAPIKRNLLLIVSFMLMFVKFDQIVIDLLATYGDKWNYSYYATWGADEYLKYDLSWKMLLVLLGKFILILWIINNKQAFIKNKQQEVLFNLFFIGVILTFPLYPMLIFRRLLFYINIIEILIYPLFIQRKKHAKIIFIIYSLIFYFANLLEGFSSPLPYSIRGFF
jgi:EpsG family